jgi:mono/diheme cytochrome c family protein
MAASRARLFLVFVLLSILAVMLAACQQESAKPDDAVLLQDPRYIMGSGLYKRHCAGCHGDRGEGRTSLGPAINSQEWQDGITDDEITDAIVSGRKVAGTSMASFADTLTKDEVAAVVVYVRTLK